MAALNDDGLLPEGIHNLTLQEVESLFGKVDRTGRRMQLFKRLEEYVKEAQGVEAVEHLLVDGSFVTSKEEPGDVDMILVLRPGVTEAEEWRPADYNVISRRRVSKRFGLDLLVARSDGEELPEYIEFFSQVRGFPQLRKGIVRLLP